MTSLLIPLVAALSTPAQAAGVGTSVGVLANDLGGFKPSLDLHLEPVLLQIHVLEFLEELSDNNVQLGANVYFDAADADLPGTMRAVFQPGVGGDLFIDDDEASFFLTGDARVGGQWAGPNGGFGIYVVPAIGLLFDDNGGNNPFFAGGAVQISAWFGN